MSCSKTPLKPQWNTPSLYCKEFSDSGLVICSPCSFTTQYISTWVQGLVGHRINKSWDIATTCGRRYFLWTTSLTTATHRAWHGVGTYRMMYNCSYSQSFFCSYINSNLSSPKHWFGSPSSVLWCLHLYGHSIMVLTLSLILLMLRSGGPSLMMYISSPGVEPRHICLGCSLGSCTQNIHSPRSRNKMIV